MRFLVDAQLPPALARWLSAQGVDAEHAMDVNLTSASDREIWEYAVESLAIIVTKDEDFALQRALFENGPTIIWIRTGNTSRRELLSRFSGVYSQVIAALERGEVIIEVS